MALPDLSPEDQYEIQRLEEAMWLQSTRFDAEFQESHFAEDFVEFGRSGRIYTRHEIIQTNPIEIKAKLPLPNYCARVIDINTVLVTYNSEAVYGEDIEFARRSSLWSRTKKGWVMRFHQGTPYLPAASSQQFSACGQE